MYPGRKELAGTKSRYPGYQEEGERRRSSPSLRKVLPPAPEMHSGGPGCARSGLWLPRISSDPIRAWADDFAPFLVLPAPSRASWGPGDVSKTLPRPEHEVGAKIREVPCAPGSAHCHRMGFGAPPRVCGYLGPRLRSRRVADGFLAGGGPVPALHREGGAATPPRRSPSSAPVSSGRARRCAPCCRASPRPFVSAS